MKDDMYFETKATTIVETIQNEGVTDYVKMLLYEIDIWLDLYKGVEVDGKFWNLRHNVFGGIVITYDTYKGWIIDPITREEYERIREKEFGKCFMQNLSDVFDYARSDEFVSIIESQNAAGKIKITARDPFCIMDATQDAELMKKDYPEIFLRCARTKHDIWDSKGLWIRMGASEETAQQRERDHILVEEGYSVVAVDSSSTAKLIMLEYIGIYPDDISDIFDSPYSPYWYSCSGHSYDADA